MLGQPDGYLLTVCLIADAFAIGQQRHFSFGYVARPAQRFRHGLPVLRNVKGIERMAVLMGRKPDVPVMIKRGGKVGAPEPWAVPVRF